MFLTFVVVNPNPQECWKAPDKPEEDGHKFMLGFKIIAMLFYELLLSSYEDFSFLPLYPHSTSLKAGKRSHKSYWSILNNYGSDGIYSVVCKVWNCMYHSESA